MPRKSSKTAHVMNLLAGDKNTKENETTAKQEEIREESAGHAPEPAPTEAVSTETGAELSDASAIEADPVAELIREKLEEELEQTLKGSGTPGQEEATREEPGPEIPKQQAGPEPGAVEPPPEPKSEAVEEPQPEPEPGTAGSQSEPGSGSAGSQSEPEQESVEPQAEPETPGVSEEPVEEPSYQYVNVMEKIVNDEVIYFMREFDMCMCDRCIADTKALALTKMPAKYIVREKSAIPPLMNFYANKFIGYVTVELTKACTVVKETPHHDR